MLTLSKTIRLDPSAIREANLCKRFSAEDLEKIGAHVHAGYLHDKASRSKWERRTQAAMDLAMQVSKEKSFPWPGCSNIAFPLITIGALQFHSRAYPAVISGTEIVKCRVIGADETGAKTERAQRISTHMSWQCLEEDPAWEEQKDRLLINLPIVGSTFVKSYYCADRRRNIHETVLAQDLVIDYWAKSVSSCPRKTHVIPFFRNTLHSNIKRGTFRDVSEEPWYGQPPASRGDTGDARRDNRIGLSPPPGDETTPFLCLEQHVDLDLDGDGYAEPYIITVEESSKSVLRIVTGFDRPEDVERNTLKEIVSIRRMEYFTKYEFIPSPDGGIYGVGFGVLLGPLNESTNSLVNQLVDAGTMSVTGGGFLGRGAKMRGGTYTFAPLEWKRVDSTGDDLRKSIFPLPVKEPNATLFQLLSLLINYVERLSGTTDPMVGENPGQNTTAETMRTMVQEGQRIYSAIFKRVWRSMKEEFKKGYILNGLYMPLRKSFGQGQDALREDYLGNPDEVAPAADPTVVSEQARIMQAQLLKQSAAVTPGYDIEEVERRYLRALKVEGIDQVYPGAKKTGTPKDPKVTIAEMKTQVEMAKLQVEQQTEMARLQSEQQRFAMEMQEQIRLNSAEIFKIAADIENARETLRGDVQDRQIGMLNAVLGLAKTRNDMMIKKLELMMKAMEMDNAASESGNVRRLEGASRNRSANAGSQTAAAAAA